MVLYWNIGPLNRTLTHGCELEQRTLEPDTHTWLHTGTEDPRTGLSHMVVYWNRGPLNRTLTHGFILEQRIPEQVIHKQLYTGTEDP